jgi:predicted dehydrogenase
MIRIGLLGASKIAPTAVIGPVGKSDAFEITAVAARDPARARAYAETHGIAGVSEDYAGLVRRDDVDVVYNGLPPAAHEQWTVAALEAGKVVLCEKPFARNADEARRMVGAADRTGNLLLEAFHYRHHRVMRRAEQIVASGALGRLTKGEGVFNVAIAKTPGELRWSVEQGGGGLMDLGCYPLHALRTLIGSEPEVESAEAEFVDGVDSRMSAHLRFAGGVEGSIACAMIAERPSAALTLTGERGSMTIVNFLAPQIGCRFTTTIDGVTAEEPVEGPTTYEAQLEDLRAVMLDGVPQKTGGADAIGNMEAIDAIYRAAGRA